MALRLWSRSARPAGGPRRERVRGRRGRRGAWRESGHAWWRCGDCGLAVLLPACSASPAAPERCGDRVAREVLSS